MKKILMIVQVIDEDTGVVDENFTMEVEKLPQSGIDLFKSKLTAFGIDAENEAMKGGVKKNQIKKHHGKHKKD